MEKIIQLLKIQHPNALCELNFGSNFELLVSVILSAQCTDKRVNKVTENLFKLYNTPLDFVQLDIGELEKLIYSCGFYHSKALAIKSASQSILENFAGEVPSSIEELMSLRGVGRKTANVVFSVGFKGDAIAVDTHVFRVSNRIGIANAKDVLNCEKQLMLAIPKESWSEVHHLLIHHGRYICNAKSPKCGECLISDYCKYYSKNIR